MSSLQHESVVVVTGATAGVGRAVVRAFAERGARLALLARGCDRLEAARRETQGFGAEAMACAVDVADAGQVEAAAEAIEKQLGPIDVWINNAMTTVHSPLLKMTLEEFRRVTDVCYLGFVHGTMSALRRMVSRDRGVIVQVGSSLAYRGIPLQSAYCGAKHAIRGFTDSIRCELLYDGSRVRLTMVQLPGLNTPQFRWCKSRMPRKAQPIPPIMQPEVAAEAILWAAAHHPRELNVGLNTSLVIAGQKLFPGLGDRYLAWTAYEGQMTDEPQPPDQPHNLWQPVPGDHGAHGDFDDCAKKRSLHLKIQKYRGWLAVAGAAGALGVAGVAALLALREQSRS